MARRPSRGSGGRAGRSKKSKSAPKSRLPKICAMFVYPEIYPTIEDASHSMPFLLKKHYDIPDAQIAKLPRAIQTRRSNAWAVWKAMIRSRTPRMIITGTKKRLPFVRRLDRGKRSMLSIEFLNLYERTFPDQGRSRIMRFLDEQEKQGVRDIVLVGGERGRALRRVAHEILKKKPNIRVHVVFDASATHEVEGFEGEDMRGHERDKQRFKGRLHTTDSRALSHSNKIRKFRAGLTTLSS